MAQGKSRFVEINRLVPKRPTGLVVVITGHGKGKTTSALGMALRACGHGMRVCIIQFMKGDLYAGGPVRWHNEGPEPPGSPAAID